MSYTPKQRRSDPSFGPYHGNFEWYLDFLSAVEYRADIIANFGKFINVKERQPEYPEGQEGVVLAEGIFPCETPEGDYEMQFCTLPAWYDREHNEWCDPTGSVVANVTRWMPLPNLDDIKPIVAQWDEFLIWLHEASDSAFAVLKKRKPKAKKVEVDHFLKFETTDQLYGFFRTAYNLGVSADSMGLVWLDLMARKERDGALPQAGTIFGLSALAVP
jgi:hypothetical protein